MEVSVEFVALDYSYLPPALRVRWSISFVTLTFSVSVSEISIFLQVSSWFLGYSNLGHRLTIEPKQRFHICPHSREEILHLYNFLRGPCATMSTCYKYIVYTISILTYL